jgi:hypothetical protein
MHFPQGSSFQPVSRYSVGKREVKMHSGEVFSALSILRAHTRGLPRDVVYLG